MAEEQSLSGVLCDVVQYFMFCKANAAKGSAAERRFMTYIDTVNDALELLKAQEPRVMTLAELWHMEHRPVCLERKNSLLYITEPSIVLKTERCYIPSLGDSYILMRENKIHDKYWACDYNKTWRCWSCRPTDEQRKAVKWE